MTDLREILATATDRVEVDDLGAAALAEAHRRRHRRRAVIASMAAACVVVAAAGVGERAAHDDGPGPGEDPTPATPSPSGPATQSLWDPFDLGSMQSRDPRLEPHTDPGSATIADDPVAGVVVAWPQVGGGLRLLGTDGRWRSAPHELDPEEGTGGTNADAPTISDDATRVAVATEAGIRVLDVTSGDVDTTEWPAALVPPWDATPSLRWLPDDQSLLVTSGAKSWIISPDGAASRAPYGDSAAYAPVGIDPEGPIYESDYSTRTLLTWVDGSVADEAPFPQCERLSGGFGLVACTTGSLENGRSGPVVVDPTSGQVLAYAPIEDPNAVYSDNGYLTTLGFLDEETVLLLVGAADFDSVEIGKEDWYLVAWHFRNGTLEKITSGDTHMQDIAVNPPSLG